MHVSNREFKSHGVRFSMDSDQFEFHGNIVITYLAANCVQCRRAS